MSNIAYDEFKKIELKVAKVLEAKRVEGSDKLLQLKVDLGGEWRQIIAGIGKVYDLADLPGRQIIIVANLEPRQLMGLESQGMLLAVDSPEGPILLCPDKKAPSGSNIK